MINIKRDSDLFTISFLKSDVTDNFLHSLLKEIEIENYLQKNKMTESDAWNLSEEIKENWWRENKEKILSMIGSDLENCH